MKVIVPLRPCDSRTLTEQTLGRGLRKMHAPVLDDDGAAELRSEGPVCYRAPVLHHHPFQDPGVIEQRETDDIDHSREYVPILQNEDEAAREEVDVRLPRFEGVVQAAGDWTRSFESSKMPPLAPKITWQEDIPETEITTYLKKARRRRRKKDRPSPSRRTRPSATSSTYSKKHS